MKSKFSKIILRKPILRLAFVLCCPLFWAATCQTAPVEVHIAPADQSLSDRGEPNRAAEENSSFPADTVKVKAYSKDELLGRFEPSKHPDFALIQAIHTTKSEIYMQREAYQAFEKMYAALKREGNNISIISATRNFNYQKGIWERKWVREKYKGMSDRDKVADIMKYSSMPGTSRHHWGTDVDFNSVELNYWQSSAGAKLYAWLSEHAAEYGFHQTYTDKSSGRSGYEEEKWHWSYMPIARQMHQQYRKEITYADINGFSGCQEASVLKVFETYVDGIDGGLMK